MKLERTAVLTSVVGGLLSLACGGHTHGPGDPPVPAKDSEVRTYIRDQLEPYLAKIAEQLCLIKYDQAPTVGDEELCTGGPDGYKPPPKNGNP
jgi:hypothetical protein